MNTALYWIYDADGMLIYIGVADDPPKRFAQHAQSSAWWVLAARHNLQWYGTRTEAEKAEAAAIKRHDPYFNRVHAINPPGNPVYDAGIKALCAQLGISRSVLVTTLIDRELAARGLLGSLPCFHTMLGWPAGISVPDCDTCGS